MIGSNRDEDGLPADNCLSGGGEKEVLLRAIFPGESEMAEQMRAFDWAASDFGPVERWPENLRVAVRLCLTSRFPILLWWGPRLALLYNDAYLPWLSEAKHPRALGRPGYECWSEIWETIGPMMEGVLSTGQATWSVDTELFFDRKVRKEEVYITWTYAPILATDGQTVDGIFNPCFETSEQVIGARRLETLRKLGIRAGEGRTVEAACQEAAAVLRENTRDIPCAAIYVANETGDEATLCATMVLGGEHLLPVSASASDDHACSPWPLASVLQTKHAAECTDLDARGVRLPGGPWPEVTRQALVLPIHAAQDQLAGLLVAGVSPRRPLDAAYRTFFDLVAGHVATAISDARAYEAERQRAEALAELDRAKTAFFSNVSHEFRTPLTLMLGPIEEMLARANGSLTVGREELDLVQRNTLRVLKLVNTLLDFSRIEAGRIEAVYEPTDLGAYTAELASMFRSAIEKAGLTLSVDCPALPEPVYVDREMWEKIVLNLLSNAFKYTFEGEVKVGLQWYGKRVKLAVADTGVGIPEAELLHIFERFHRVRDARSRTHEGTGIGLSLVQELVKLHGGDVTAESAVGRGTTFSVSIPTGAGHLPQERIGATRTVASTAMGATPFVEEALRWLPEAEVSHQSVVAPPAPPTTGDEPRTTGKARILVADDNADMRQYVRRILADRYTVTAVADGVAALDAARREPPELILADVMMPNLDGFGLLRQVRDDARLAGVPVVLLSARAAEEATVEGMQAGADDYLIKPFSARELLARVSARLEIARTNREAIEREREMRTSAEEAEGMTRLHELSTRLLAATELQPLLDEVLEATMTMLNADFGNVQLCDPETGALKIVAQRGFQQEFLDYFDRVEEGTASCGAALQRGERVVVEDVETDPIFAPHRTIVAAAGYRAVQSTPLFSRGGEPLGMISTHFRRPHRPSERELRLVDLYARQAAEMIERNRAEEALRRTEERFRLLVESVQDYAIFVLDSTGHVISWNAGAEHITGYRSEEIIGRHFSCFYPPEDLRIGKPEVDLRIAAAEGRFKDEGWRIRKDGSRFWANIVITALRGPQGELVGFSKITRDLSERKQAEEALGEAQAELAHVTRVTMLGELVASIAHEVNQPLGAIVTNGQAGLRLLARESPDLHKSREVIERMISDGLRASDVITRVRALLKRQDAEKAPLNVNEIIQEVIALMSPELSKSEIHLQTALVAGLPAVLGDRVQLQQVLLNLILNAKEAMSGVGWQPRELGITSLVSQSGEVMVAVRDSGTGLDPRDGDRIFDAFFTTKAEGLGLGLSISWRIIEAHGGRLWATPNEDQGATIQFTLPASGRSG